MEHAKIDAATGKVQMVELSNLNFLVGILGAATGILGVLTAALSTLWRASKKRKVKITTGSQVFVISENMTAEDFKKLSEILAPLAVKDNKDNTAATENDNGTRQ